MVRIDYKNGSGTGNVLWRLGRNGDFAINSTDPFPWFTHQRDAAYESGGTTLLSLLDNGNTRVLTNPGTVENSRGQLLNIDETHMQVTLQLNADLGLYAASGGSAQLLPNGNFHFNLGLVQPSHSFDFELLPDGTINYEMRSGANAVAHRSWRMNHLYNPPM